MDLWTVWFSTIFIKIKVVLFFPNLLLAENTQQLRRVWRTTGVQVRQKLVNDLQNPQKCSSRPALLSDPCFKQSA